MIPRRESSGALVARRRKQGCTHECLRFQERYQAEVRVAAAMAAALGDAVVWDRPVVGPQRHTLTVPGRWRGEALQLDMARVWRDWQATHKALELLERYDGRVELVLTVRLSELAREVRVVAPVALAPDTFSPGPAERWSRQETIPVMKTGW